MELFFPIPLIFGFVTAWGVSLAGIPLVIRWASNKGIFDLPDSTGSLSKGRRVHSVPIPRLGGIAIVGSFFVANFVWAPSRSFNVIFLASLVLFLMGLIDDLRAIRAKYKFAVQLIAVCVVVNTCELALPHLALTPNYAIPLPTWLGTFLSVFVLVGAINAINMIDGLDGLAGGVAIISIALLSLVYFVRTEDLSLIALLSIPMFGSVLGFLRYNTHPASIFMGDSGSNWLGFMAGFMLLATLGNFDGLSIVGLNSIARTQQGYFPMASGVLCLAIPVFDTACVIVSRLKSGLNPARADNRHFHHGLLRLGLSHSQSVTSIYFLSLIMGVIGILPVLFMRYDFWWTPYLGIAFLLGIITRFSPVFRNLIKPLLMQFREGSRGGRDLLTSRMISRWERFNRCCIYGIFLVSPIFAGSVRKELGYAALAGLLLVAATQFLKKEKNDFTFSLAMSIGTIILLTSNNQNPMMISMLGKSYSFQVVYNILFISLFISTFGQVLVTLRRNFLIFTPSDFLLASFPLLLTLLPEATKVEYRLDIIALRSFVVFMAIRVMVRKHKLTMRKLSLVNAVALGYVVAAGLLQLRIIY